MRYSMDSDPDISARAQAVEVDISPKHSVEICNKIRGMQLQSAKDYLSEVIELKTPVPFKKYNGKVGHRKGKGFGPGRGRGLKEQTGKMRQPRSWKPCREAEVFALQRVPAGVLGSPGQKQKD